jgi:hypothetical protein
MLDAVYDPYDTLRWMVADAGAQVVETTYTDESGRTRKKAKERRAMEAARYETLCEVLWNVAGRPMPLDDVIAGEMAVAA